MNRVINVEMPSEGKVKKNRKIILKEERKKISKSKKNWRRKIIEKSNSQDRVEVER